jgi:F0F1-type ATP synthase assembly protein I
MDRRADRQALWNGFGKGFSLAFELVLVPATFGLFGWWLDRRSGLHPTFLVLFLVLGTVGVAVRTYYTYAAQMAAQEKNKPWTRSRP